MVEWLLSFCYNFNMFQLWSTPTCLTSNLTIVYIVITWCDSQQSIFYCGRCNSIPNRLLSLPREWASQWENAKYIERVSFHVCTYVLYMLHWNTSTVFRYDEKYREFNHDKYFSLRLFLLPGKVISELNGFIGINWQKISIKISN